MINKLIITEFYINPEHRKLFWVDSEYDYQLSKRGFFELKDNEIEAYNFDFDRMYDDEIKELLTLIMNHLSDIKERFKLAEKDPDHTYREDLVIMNK